MSAINPLPPLTADAQTMALARENCAERLRARGYPDEAAKFERGDRDFTWALRHEVARLLGETGRAAQ